jgi:hypothetical protein
VGEEEQGNRNNKDVPMQNGLGETPNPVESKGDAIAVNPAQVIDQ